MACEYGGEAATLRRSLLGYVLAADGHRAALAADLGLGARDLLAVQHIAYAGELTPAQLGRRLQLSSAGYSTLVRRLELAGCAAREAHPTDGRSVRLQLTPGDPTSSLGRARTRERRDRQAGGGAQPSAVLIVQRFLDDVSAVSERHGDALANTTDRVRASAVRLPPLWA